MKRALWLACLLLSGCPSLDGFSGKTKASVSDAGPKGKGFLSLEEAVRLCSKVQTCPTLGYSVGYSLLVPINTKSYSACIDVLTAPLPQNQLGVAQQAQALACAAQASSCPAAAGCLPYEYVEPNDPRCQGADGGANGNCSPDNSAVYDCFYNRVIHCNNPYFYPGSSCLPDSNGVYQCAASATCSTGATCKGSVVTFCSTGNVAYGTDCAYWGASCGKDQASGSQNCILNGITPTCTNDSVQCVSNRVRTCFGKFFSEIDCVSMGGKCDPDPIPHCTHPSDVCKQTDPDVAVCDGDTIQLCLAGKPQSYDCASIGLSCLVGLKGGYCG
jgi:hypothetical protein